MPAPSFFFLFFKLIHSWQDHTPIQGWPEKKLCGYSYYVSGPIAGCNVGRSHLDAEEGCRAGGETPVKGRSLHAEAGCEP